MLVLFALRAITRKPPEIYCFACIIRKPLEIRYFTCLCVIYVSLSKFDSLLGYNEFNKIVITCFYDLLNLNIFGQPDNDSIVI